MYMVVMQIMIKMADAEKNKVTISAGSKVSEDIYGGYATHNTNENKVSITNGAEVGQNVLVVIL